MASERHEDVTTESSVKSGHTPKFFSISSEKLMLLSVLTLNIYDLYWFYRNWKEVKESEGTHIRPFWRAFFSVFFCYGLFERVMRAAEAKGFSIRYSVSQITVAYILLAVGGNIWGRMDPLGAFIDIPIFVALLLLTPLPLIYVQHAINHVDMSAGREKPSASLTNGELFFSILGGLFVLLIVIGLMAG